jgi:hypothetical protein
LSADAEHPRDIATRVISKTYAGRDLLGEAAHAVALRAHETRRAANAIFALDGLGAINARVQQPRDQEGEEDAGSEPRALEARAPEMEAGTHSAPSAVEKFVSASGESPASESSKFHVSGYRKLLGHTPGDGQGFVVHARVQGQKFWAAAQLSGRESMGQSKVVLKTLPKSWFDSMPSTTTYCSHRPAIVFGQSSMTES